VNGLGGSGHALAFPSAKSIMLPNEVFALACRAYYDEIGLIVDETNGEFAHCPLTREECDTGYYLLHGHHQHQGLLQSRDLGKCCFFVGHAKKWLEELDYFPDNYFELWDIYEEYTKKHQIEAANKSHMEKDENGKSKRALDMNKKLHQEKDENGKSKHSSKIHAEKDDEGKSKNAMKAAKKAHTERTRDGKSMLGIKNGKKINEKKDEFGRSINALKGLEKVHAEKNENGKSKNAVKGAATANSQVWESLIDGYRSTAAGVAKYHRGNNWDPNARVRIK
jgi:hypothetical protein